MSRLATEMLRDIDKDTVDFVPNYDGTRSEPTVLPARFPNLLLNGSSGIAVGMATNIPPHNLARGHRRHRSRYIENPSITIEGLMAHVKGPDFPTGGIILGRSGIRDAYETGRGRVRVRAKAHTEDDRARQGGDHRHRAALRREEGRRRRPDPEDRRAVREKKIPASPTSRTTLRARRHAAGHRAQARRAAQGRAEQALQAHVDADDLRREHGRAGRRRPADASLREVIGAYVDHQREVIVRRTKFELAQKEARAHVLEGLLIALDNLDAIIDLIRAVARPRAARGELQERFGLSGDPGDGDPRPAALAAHRAGGRRDQAGARRRHRAHRRAARDPRRRGAACWR